MPSPIAWTPAFAGEREACAPLLPPRRRPGPNWETSLTTDALSYFDLTNWAPASAGVVTFGKLSPSNSPVALLILPPRPARARRITADHAFPVRRILADIGFLRLRDL